MPASRMWVASAVNFVNGVGWGNVAVYPAMFAAFRVAFDLNPGQLAWITTIRSLCRFLSAPLWGYLADMYSRKLFMVMGCVVCAFATCFVGVAKSYWGVIVAVSINGMGLGMTLPNLQTITALMYEPAERGAAFGRLMSSEAVGAMVFVCASTVISQYNDVPFAGYTIEGWRLVVFGVAVLELVGAGALLVLVRDAGDILAQEKEKMRVDKEEVDAHTPLVRGSVNAEQGGDDEDKGTQGASYGSTATPETGTEKAGKEDGHTGGREASKPSVSLEHFVTIMTTPSFLLLVAQGMFGTIPWEAQQFFILWFESMGMTGFEPVAFLAATAVGTTIGYVIGGLLGDWAARRVHPQKGRVLVAQVSVFAGIPMTFVLLQVIPQQASMVWAYMLVGFVTGTLIVWTSPGCNMPLIADTIEEEALSTAFSVDRMFEGSVGALGPVLVGWVAGWFGYDNSYQGQPLSAIPPATLKHNVSVFADAMTVVQVVPWTVCCLTYTGLYWTYERDIERRKERQRIARMENTAT